MSTAGAHGYPSSLLLTIVILVGCTSPGASAAPTGSSAGPSPTGAEGTAQQPSPAATTETPAITGLTGHVVFARAGGMYGDETTFVMNIDGSDEHQIGELANSGFPWATPDGSKVIVGTESNGRLGASIFDLDGTNEFVVPEPDALMFGSAPLTADGKHLVAETFTSPGFEFAATNVVEVATGKLRKLVDDHHYISGDISADGSKVLLFLNNPAIEPPAPGSLWVVGLDGKGLRQVTPSGTVAQCCMNYRWSPDGRTVLFASPEGGLWTIGVDGRNLTEIFHADGKWAITPTFSPDGSMIMFALDPSANPFRHPTNELYVIRADGSDLTLVFGGGTFKREPIWLP
jgi:Tol biopolymer transport system component